MKKAASRFYVGNTPRKLAADSRSQRYFYGLRSADGELILGKVDSWDANDGVQVNRIGDDPTQDFPYFVPGQDFFEGRDEGHASRYGSLIYDQYKFTDGDFNYYVDDNGELTLRVYQGIDEGDVLIPDVPIRPPTVDYRKYGIFPTMDNTNVTMDNTTLTMDNEEQ